MSALPDPFFDISQELLCIIDCDGNFIKANHSCASCLGYAPTDLIGKSLFDFIHQDEISSIKNTISDANYLTSSASFCCRLKQFDNSYHWFNWKITSDPQNHCIYASAADITDSKRKSSYLEVLTNFKKIGYWEIDLDTEKLFWSDHVHLIHETDPKNYKPKLQDGLNFYHPESIPILTNAVNRQMETGEPYDLELRFITAKGNHKWVKASSHSEFKNGKPIRLFGLFEDITEQIKKREQDLMLKERIELAHKASGIGVWEYDLTNNNLIWDKSMYEIYEKNPKNFSGAYEAWRDSVHPDDKEKSEEELALALSGEKEFITNFRIITAQNKVKYIAAIATVMHDKNNQPVKMLGVNWDISEHEKIKQELEEKSLIAEKSSQAKSMFIANMSHELRTPLNSVLGYSNRILKTEKNLSERAAKGLETIHKSGNYLLSLINDLLDLSKIDAGKFELNVTLVDVRQLVQEVYMENKIHAEEKNLIMEVALSKEATTFTDETRLKQILNNIISNAIKYTKEGAIQVQLSQQDTQIIIEITDTGMGIREEDKSRLFKRFEQFDENSKFKIGSGSGLGLAITWELLKLLHGNIHVESELNEGTSFTITIPKLKK